MYILKVLVQIPLVAVSVAACGFLASGCGRDEIVDDGRPEPTAEEIERTEQLERKYEEKAEKKQAATGKSFGP
jgi:hypothetical protein